MEYTVIEGTKFIAIDGRVAATGPNLPSPTGVLYGALTFEDRTIINDVIVDANLDTLLNIEEQATFYFRKVGKQHILLAIDTGKQLYTLNNGRLGGQLIFPIIFFIILTLIGLPLSLFVIGLPLVIAGIVMLCKLIPFYAAINSVGNIRRAHARAPGSANKLVSA